MLDILVEDCLSVVDEGVSVVRWATLFVDREVKDTVWVDKDSLLVDDCSSVADEGVIAVRTPTTNININ